jgi:hypothetical protein
MMEGAQMELLSAITVLNKLGFIEWKDESGCAVGRIEITLMESSDDDAPITYGLAVSNVNITGDDTKAIVSTGFEIDELGSSVFARLMAAA